MRGKEGCGKRGGRLTIAKSMILILVVMVDLIHKFAVGEYYDYFHFFR